MCRDLNILSLFLNTIFWEVREAEVVLNLCCILRELSGIAVMGGGEEAALIEEYSAHIHTFTQSTASSIGIHGWVCACLVHTLCTHHIAATLACYTVSRGAFSLASQTKMAARMLHTCMCPYLLVWLARPSLEVPSA